MGMTLIAMLTIAFGSFLYLAGDLFNSRTKFKDTKSIRAKGLNR